MESRKITIVLDRLRSAHNTGNIFRIAEAVGASEIIACGYTPAPPHPKLAKTAMGTDREVSCRVFPSSMVAVEELREEGNSQILAVETVQDAVFAWEMEYEFPLVLIFGNEALGIEAATLEMCDGVVNLPMFGKKESINVGNSVAAVLYAIVAKSGYEKERF